MKKRLFISAAILAGLMAVAGCGSTTETDGTTSGVTASGSNVTADGTEAKPKAEHISISEMKADDYIVSIGDYKNIEIEAEKKEVTEADITNTINQLLESKATTEVVEGRALQTGDIANINYVGKMNGEEFQGGTDDSENGYDLTIGSNSFIPGFETALIGMNPGETRDIDLVFPEQYYEELAGKPVVFTVTLNSIKERVLPELTDDFVKNDSGIEGASTVDDIKGLVKDMLEEESQKAYDSAINSGIMNKIIDICEFKDELPEGRYQFYYDSKYDNDEAMATDYGLQLEGYVMYVYGVQDLNGYLSVVDDYAKKSTRLDLAVLKILELEGKMVTDEELEQNIADNYESYGCASVEEFKEKYSVDEYLAYLMNMRAIDIVKENMKVVAPK